MPISHFSKLVHYHMNMETEDLLLKLSKKFSSPAYAFLGQVRNQTGYGNHEDGIRTADALALGLWPSRGNYLHGFELKVSRQDWIKEFKDPSKAEAVVKYCDMFSLVISDMSIIDISEVPKTWGIMVAKSGTIKTTREAPLLKAKPMSRAFLCGFMRKVTEQIQQIYTPTTEVEETIKNRVDAQITYELGEAARTVEKYERLVKNLKLFQETSGLDLEDLEYLWTNPIELGEAVKTVLEGKDKQIQIRKRLSYLQDTIRDIAKNVDEELKTFDKKAT